MQLTLKVSINLYKTRDDHIPLILSVFQLVVNVHLEAGASTCDDENENALLTNPKVPMS